MGHGHQPRNAQAFDAILETKGARRSGFTFKAYFYFDFRDTAKQNIRSWSSSEFGPFTHKGLRCCLHYQGRSSYPRSEAEAIRYSENVEAEDTYVCPRS
jgi:hypothetical protein